MKKWMRWMAAAVLAEAAFVASYPLGGYIARNSDAYAEAERFLRASAAVGDRIGACAASLDLKGSRTVAKAYVELERRGSWVVRVARLSLPGQPAEELPTK